MWIILFLLLITEGQTFLALTTYLECVPLMGVAGFPLTGALMARGSPRDRGMWGGLHWWRGSSVGFSKWIPLAHIDSSKAIPTTMECRLWIPLAHIDSSRAIPTTMECRLWIPLAHIDSSRAIPTTMECRLWIPLAHIDLSKAIPTTMECRLWIPLAMLEDILDTLNSLIQALKLFEGGFFGAIMGSTKIVKIKCL